MFDPTIQEVGSSASDSPQLCRRFTFSEIQLVTQNLDESLVIGRGGFGKVYKGTITYGEHLLTAAVKRLDSNSNQGASEFWAEVNMLSNLRHCHLVSLIGYCNEGQEMILVYEYMSHGTLQDHLHRRQIPLTWVQRLAICIGGARGLDYLHTGTGIKQGVIHRDVKSSNILLHDSWAAKISDFGLSKICPKNQQSTYVNTIVKGTFGYLDPDYFYTGKLTRKSDVYAFGVVLFEVLCGKRAVDSSIEEEQWALAIWAQESIRKGRLKQSVDTNIRGSISPKCLKLFAWLAKGCLDTDLKQRPTMAEVVVGLESILTLQEKANNKLQPTGIKFFARKAPKVILPSNDENSGCENRRLHQFDYNTINVATKNFSKWIAYDFLYKGKLQNGKGIALYLDTCEEGHMIGTSILVKLEHENVAKLLGYCIHRTKMFYVYESVLHATLDCLMFGCTILDWDKAYKIILGLARALLYLHKHAPIRIIHGNVYPGNIFLDESFNPKLVDFQYAKAIINETDRIRLNTICRNHHRNSDYMAPEYTSYGVFSTKADVYSLGVLVLETVTGHRMLEYMFRLKNDKRNWLEGILSAMIDLQIDVDSSSMTRFTEIGLLCLQTNAEDRPTMEEVVSMLLDNSSLTLPMAKMRERVTGEGSRSIYA